MSINMEIGEREEKWGRKKGARMSRDINENMESPPSHNPPGFTANNPYQTKDQGKDNETMGVVIKGRDELGNLRWIWMTPRRPVRMIEYPYPSTSCVKTKGEQVWSNTKEKGPPKILTVLATKGYSPIQSVRHDIHILFIEYFQYDRFEKKKHPDGCFRFPGVRYF